MYHLEDKALLDGLGNDTIGTRGLQEVKAEMERSRPKRKSYPPKHLKDFV